MSEIFERMSMNRWWNDTDNIKPQKLERNLSQYHCVHHKSHMEWPGIKPGPTPKPWHGHLHKTRCHLTSCTRITAHQLWAYRGLWALSHAGNAVSWGSLMCNYSQRVSCHVSKHGRTFWQSHWIYLGFAMCTVNISTSEIFTDCFCEDMTCG
jgi:hypothetical protein